MMAEFPHLFLQWYTPEESRNLPRLAYLLDNFIPRAGLVMLYGRSGAGKSFLALDWAAQVAMHGKVLYLVTEGQGGFPRRIAAWEAFHARPMGQLILFGFQAVNLLDEHQADELLTRLAHTQPALVVFDTLVNCTPGADENSTKDMGRAMQVCQQMVKESGTSVLLVHHKTKSGEWERGSTVLRAAMDVMVEIDERDGLFTVSCGKTKDAVPFPQRYYRLQPIAGSGVLVPTDPVEWRNYHRPLSGPEQAVLAAMAEDEFVGKGVRVPDLATRLPTITERTIYRALRTLKRRGLVEQAQARAPYALAEKGRAFYQSTISPDD
jgi:tellurite resistance-related uncharacterized protein